MFMYLVQTWFWLLLFFVVGAVIAAVIAGMLYRPIDEVREEMARELDLTSARKGNLR